MANKIITKSFSGALERLIKIIEHQQEEIDSIRKIVLDQLKVRQKEELLKMATARYNDSLKYPDFTEEQPKVYNGNFRDHDYDPITAGHIADPRDPARTGAYD